LAASHQPQLPRSNPELYERIRSAFGESDVPFTIKTPTLGVTVNFDSKARRDLRKKNALASTRHRGRKKELEDQNKELSARVEELTARNKELTARNKELEAHIEALEARRKVD
jgi:predicted RNase H-like nuclease (RuvC/YqgF family)